MAPRRSVLALLTPVAAIILTVALLGSLWGAAPGRAQTDAPGNRLEVGAVDTSQFPAVALNLIATDRQSRPVRELSALRLREHGAPVADYEITPVTAGVNLFVVVDANRRIQEADDESGLSRLQKVKDSILLYGGRFMDLALRDHVTVIVPDGEDGRLLVQDETAPAALIDAVRAYDAGRLPESDPIALLTLALDQAAAAKASGRFQAIVLYSDAGSLNSFRFPPLIARAQELQIPIFVALLGGAQPNETALETAEALAIPTRGFVVHVPAAADSSEIFQIVTDNGEQSQLRYRSNVTRSGIYTVAVSLNNLRAVASLDLSLAPPRAILQTPQTTIVRAGAEQDTPLEALQPSVQPVEVLVTWPDGLPRSLRGASLLADGDAQDAPFVTGDSGDAQILLFDWRIQELDAGRYTLTARVTDTLGLATESEPVAVTIDVARPQPVPTAMPTSTPQPFAAIREALPALPSAAQVRPYLAPLGGALALLVLLVMLLRRRAFSGARVPATSAAPGAPLPEEDGEDTTGATQRAERVFLKAVEDDKTVALEGANMTIGRDEGHVTIFLDDASVSGLHARIRYREGFYWLYDEGSQHGTLLNHERLGLAPRLLEHGDQIQIGRRRFVFLVVKIGGDEPEHVGPEGDEVVAGDP